MAAIGGTGPEARVKARFSYIVCQKLKQKIDYWATYSGSKISGEPENPIESVTETKLDSLTPGTEALRE